jgi:hypothetical protein
MIESSLGRQHFEAQLAHADLCSSIDRELSASNFYMSLDA